MSSRRRYRKTPSHGKHHKRRPGTHKHRSSPETERWNAEYLIPERPSWLPVETYTKLAALRETL